MRRKLLWVASAGAVVVVGLVVADRMLFGFSGPLAPVQRTLARTSSSAEVGWSVVGRDFGGVTDIQFVPGSNKRALVLLKAGTVHHVSFEPGHAVTRASSPEVLQVAVRTNSELGLLGLAFHPKYLENGLFYLNYSPAGGETRTRIAEWQLDNRRLGHERASERRVILEVEQPYDNHNAGQLAFGPDGMLYVGLGDGGSRADPLRAGQDLGTLLGKMLRIDVDRVSEGRAYTVPPDNPFVGRPGARAEIWAYGLRNPWRYVFDPEGRLIVADVGQDEFEEVDIVERGDNLGWVVREGRHCFPPGTACKTQGFKDPVFEYPRRDGKSITGGTVYQGRQLPFLAGKYLCADYVSGNVWALDLPDGAADAAATLLGRFPHAITTFGRAQDGEVYAGDFASGELLKLSPGARR
ncbi:MAG TPA: PQQ-dependent sugar dehydrogenase [Polyangiaceae bacterium]|nr:PQQ-dependent sugar dehydrogenase [Polyangiaceae bacterium]